MPVHAYRTQRFSTTHENRAFDDLYDELLQVWGHSDDAIVLLGNFFCQGSEIDAAIIKRDSISVIEMKDYGGCISFSENGSWHADDVPVRGGNKPNPYIQLRDNKYALLNFLNGISEWPSKQSPNLGHISAITLFHQEIEFDYSQLPQSIKPWFHVVDMAHIAQTLCQITSRSINLTNEDIQKIVDSLGVPEYKRPGARTVRHEVASQRAGQLSETIQAAFGDLEKFVRSDQRILVISGVVGAGQQELEDAVLTSENVFQRPIVGLAPNRRLARPSHEGMGSIYQQMYMKNPSVEGEDLLVYPLGTNHDPSDCIYLITHAHLVSDSIFETDLFRYGSGRLLTDFLVWADIDQTDRKVIFSGDPYQLPRGDAEKTSLAMEYLGPCTGRDVEYIELELPDPTKEQSVLLRNSLRLAWCLKNEVYSSLRIEKDDVECIDLPGDKKARTAKVEDLIGSRPHDTRFVGFSNRQVGQVNDWLRRKVFCLSGELAPGDLVHVHNSPVFVDTDPLEESLRLEPNVWAEVLAVETDVEPVRQPLRGRTEPIEVQFLKAQLRPLGHPHAHWVYVVRDYLTSEKPELPVNSVLALRVRAEQESRKRREQGRLSGGEESGERGVAESEEDGQRLPSEGLSNALQGDPFLNAAQLRIGYGITLHRLQGMTVPQVVADADTGQGRTNPTYFRWLYTLLQSATQTLWLANSPDFNPLSEAQWDAARARLDTVRPKNLVPYRYSVDAGDQSAALSALQAQAQTNLWRCGLSLEAEEKKPYQLLWSIKESDGGTCKLRAHYDKKFRVTRLEVAQEDKEGTGAKAIDAVSVGHEPDEVVRRLIFAEVRDRLQCSGLGVVAILGESYKDTYYLSGQDGKVEVAFYYNATGLVTRCEVIRHEGSEVLEAVQSALCGANVS